MRRSWPVVVVGCGPVGLTVGNLLGSYGIPVLLLEQKDGVDTIPRAVGVDRDCLRVWQATGLDEALLKDMSPMGRDGLAMVYLDPKGRPFMEVRPERSEYGFAFGYGFIQPIADRLLLDGLARFEHVETRFGHHVDTIREDADGIEVFFRDSTGVRQSIRTRYLVASDGGQSPIRRRLGISMRGRTHSERWVVVDLREPFETELSRDVEIRCDPDRSMVSVPRRQGHRRVEVRLRGDESDAEALQRETTRLLHASPDGTEILRAFVYRFNARLATRFRSGRVFLAGDAAHVTPPFAAQGLAMGIRDAFNLCWKLARVVDGAADPALLDSYELERRRHARATIRLAVWLGRIMMPRSHWRASLVPSAIRGLRQVPALDRAIREGGPKPAPGVRGPLALNSARPGGVAGQWLHQPWVEDASGRRDKLDRLLGNGFAWLGWRVDPAAVANRAIDRALASLGARVWFVRDSDASCLGDGELSDVDGGFARWLGPRARLLLVRPDRFVAADVRPNEVDRLAPLLRRFGVAVP